jgi:hypothetical protein
VMTESEKKKAWTEEELRRFIESLSEVRCLSASELKKSSPTWRDFRRRWGAIRTLEDVRSISQAVTIAYQEDWYDWSRSDYAFTTPDAAIEFCRRHERGLVELCRPKHASAEAFLREFLVMGSFQVPPRDLYPEYAHGKVWTTRENDLAWFILHPATRPLEIDDKAVLQEFGAEKGWDAYLHEERVKAGGERIARDCWCADLREGRAPAGVEFVHVTNFDFPPQEALFITDQHDGEVRRGTCRVCGGLVLAMYVDLPGFGDEGRRYYSFPREEDLPGFTAANYESFVSSHPGIIAHGRWCRFYQKTEVASIGI